MRLESTESETARPDQTASMISSRGTMRCRFSTSIVRTEKTCGSTATGFPPRRSSYRSVSSSKDSKRYVTGRSSRKIQPLSKRPGYANFYSRPRHWKPPAHRTAPASSPGRI